MECPMSKAGNRCAKWSRSIGHSDISYFFILDCPDTTLIFSRLLQKVQSGLSDSSIIGCTQPAADRGSRERGLCSDDAKVERDANTEEWLQKPLRGGRKEMVKMSSKGTIKARDIAADVRAGLSDFDLIEKYDLSLQTLTTVLDRLVESGHLRKPELLKRVPPRDNQPNGQKTRKLPRERIPFILEVQDISNPFRRAFLRDLTEEGFRIAGIKVAVGEARDFLILADVVASLSPILVRATCRWVDQKGKRNKYHVAGFQITDISSSDLETLRRLVKVVALLNQGVSPSRLGLKTKLLQ